MVFERLKNIRRPLCKFWISNSNLANQRLTRVQSYLIHLFFFSFLFFLPFSLVFILLLSCHQFPSPISLFPYILYLSPLKSHQGMPRGTATLLFFFFLPRLPIAHSRLQFDSVLVLGGNTCRNKSSSKRRNVSAQLARV